MRVTDEEGIKRVHVRSSSLLYVVCVDLALWLSVIHNSALRALARKLIGSSVAASDVLMCIAKKLSFVCRLDLKTQLTILSPSKIGA